MSAQVKINMPTFVKRVRKTLNNNRKIISARHTYLDTDGNTCIIGAGLSKAQLATIDNASHTILDSTDIKSLVDNGIVSVDKRYVNRLDKLQEAFDEGDNESVRLRFRHLESSVKKNFPAAFKN